MVWTSAKQPVDGNGEKKYFLCMFMPPQGEGVGHKGSHGQNVRMDIKKCNTSKDLVQDIQEWYKRIHVALMMRMMK